MTELAYPIRNSLYLNITDRCTLECQFCPKHTDQGPRVHEFDLSLDHRPEVDEIIAAIGNPADYDEVVFCGFGEPTLRFKVLMEIARWVKAHGGKVRINTDGLANLVNKRDVLPEMQGVVDSLSVSMNAQNPDVYERHCHPALPGSWEAMLSFLEEAPKYIPNVTATAIDGLEGVDIQACEQLAKQRGVAFRRRQLDKVG
ncbi:MAG TPA: radical SAM protein [Thiolapillus brandeum]|uniref:Radical SAM protein n=1 Tax=Thiolapillus brandeum TaxID=1076588 RepID=A0A831RXI8_9GAMM|nr:radical SAM protein [Thiolapillus brandeum]